MLLHTHVIFSAGAGLAGAMLGIWRAVDYLMPKADNITPRTF